MTDEKQDKFISEIQGCDKDGCMVMLRYDVEFSERITDEGVTIMWRMIPHQPREVQGE